MKKKKFLVAKAKADKVFWVRNYIPSDKEIGYLQTFYERKHLNCLQRAIIELTFASIKLKGYRKIKLLAYD